MRALVLGGTEGVGKWVAQDLIKHEEITEVILGDLSLDPMKVRSKQTNGKKVSLAKIDVTDHAALFTAIRTVDVVINCAEPFFRTVMRVARVAVEAKVSYIDVCDDHQVISDLFSSAEIDFAAKDAGVTILTGMGSDPGTNNVLAKWYADQLDRVDDIYFFRMVSITRQTGAAPDHNLRMITGKTPQYLKGRLQYVEAGTGEEIAAFLGAFGLCEVRYVGRPQPITMPRYINGVKKVVIKGGLIPGWVDRFRGDDKKTDDCVTHQPGPRETAVVSCGLTSKLWWNGPESGGDSMPAGPGLKVVVKGERNRKEITYTADITGTMALTAGIPLSIAALMMAAGDLNAKGVVAPEGCINPRRFLKAVIERGIRIDQTEIIKSMLTSQLGGGRVVDYL